MSEPLTSHEIEDVLSSIRRLVSEDLRPARAAPPAPEEKAEAAAPEQDKLLLTPALRVVSTEETEETASGAEWDAGDDAGSTWPEPETSALADLSPGAFPEEEMGGEAAPGFAAFTPPAQDVYDDAGMEDAAPPAPDAFDTAPHAFIAGEDEIIWASAGEGEDASEMVEDLMERPGDPASARGHWTAQDVPGPMDWVQEETDWVEPEPIPFVAHPRKPNLAAEPLARAWADAAEAAIHAELEQAAAGIVEVVIPPAPEPEPAAKPQAAAEDARATGRTGHVEHGGAAEAGAEAGAAPGVSDAEEMRIDEAMLREIVRDIIREELAGSLGERITRNVRKLVRVEINRALAAREFE